MDTYGNGGPKTKKAYTGNKRKESEASGTAAATYRHLDPLPSRPSEILRTSLKEGIEKARRYKVSDESILDALNQAKKAEYSVPSDISPEGLEKVVGNITALTTINFDEEELGPEWTNHAKALHITVLCNEMIVARVLIDNGSALNRFAPPIGDISSDQNSGEPLPFPAVFSSEPPFSSDLHHFGVLGLFLAILGHHEALIVLSSHGLQLLGWPLIKFLFICLDYSKIANVGITVFLFNAVMGRLKKVRIGEAFSARLPIDEDYVPPMDVEDQPRESSQVGASSSGAGATSSRGRRKSGFDSVPVVLGVLDTPLLKDLGGHISAICRTQERSPIMGWRCSWKPVLALNQRASPSLKGALGRTPLGPFLTIPRIQSDRRLVAALCKRWFGETNTFHFSCCELAITPLDFVMLTEIPIVREEAGKVKLSWLAGLLKDTDIAAIDLNSPVFTNVLRIFLLYVLGSCFFMTDRSCVETSLLSLMDPIDCFDTFVWGGAIYASILAGLHRVSRGEGRSVCFFYHFLEYLDPFCPSLKVPDITSFPRSSRWSAPSSKVDSHLLEKAREELDRLTLRRVTLRPYSDFGDMIQLSCRGARRFMGRRVAFYFGICKYFLGERVLHQSDGEFRIPLSPPPEMTPVLARDAFMEQLRTAGVVVHHLVGEVVDHSFYLSWLRSVSIGPIMRPFSTRPGATKVRGKLVEKYFQMRPLLAVLEEDTRGLTEEIARLRGRFATFKDPLVTLEAVPPYQCRPRPDMSFDFEAGPAQNGEVQFYFAFWSHAVLKGAIAEGFSYKTCEHNTIPNSVFFCAKVPCCKTSCSKALKLRPKVLSTHLDAMEPFVRGNDDSTFAFQTLPNLENRRLYNKKLKRWLDSLDSSEQEAFQKLSKVPPFLDSPEMWYDQLILLAPDMLVWKCSWLHVVEVLSGISGKDHLILVGLRGSSHYLPNRVVRQFGRTQDIPVIEALKDVVEFGPSTEKLVSRLLVGWKSRVRNTFGDYQDSLATIKVEAKVTSLLAENAGLKAEVAKMGSEATAYQDRIKDLKAQVDVLETVNEEFQYFQNLIGGKKSTS
ncbi:hypothetical protein HHK36_001223 [Tetracentron sinense]|uniref:Aminotransferase-like plant mobile domain-containing protein n=1 Tax=Tetracentron sinense TaxID=13715 RepID=A0A834ZVN1_TETSI|nr:hypothetical protein HHK36_001223 [Tetracentron sinense]